MICEENYDIVILECPYHIILEIGLSKLCIGKNDHIDFQSEIDHVVLVCVIKGSSAYLMSCKTGALSFKAIPNI